MEENSVRDPFLGAPIVDPEVNWVRWPAERE